MFLLKGRKIVTAFDQKLGWGRTGAVLFFYNYIYNLKYHTAYMKR